MPLGKGGPDQSELIELAIIGIDDRIRELREKRAQFVKMASGAPSTSATALAQKATSGEKKRVFSAETRKKLKLAAKRRWARQRSEAKAGKAAVE